MPLFPPRRPREPQEPRQPRPAPRPEDRIDLLALVKGIGFVLGALLIVNFGFNSLFGALFPSAAHDAIDRRNAVVTTYNQRAQEQKDAQTAYDEAQKAGAPDAEAKAADLEARKSDAEAALAEARRLDKEAHDAIPRGLYAGSIAVLVVLLALGAIAAGYLAVRFTRGRRPLHHGIYAGAGLLLVLTFFGGLLPHPALLIIESVGLVGGGYLGGQIWVRRHGPWDGTMPAPRPPLFGGRFSRPAPVTDDEDLGEPESGDGTVVDTSLADDVASGNGLVDDDVEGPRAFGPRGRKRRRRRPTRPLSTDDDVE